MTMGGTKCTDILSMLILPLHATVIDVGYPFIIVYAIPFPKIKSACVFFR